MNPPSLPPTLLAAEVLDKIAHYAAPLVPQGETIDRLGKAIRSRVVTRGDHLCREGDAAGSLFFVKAGLLRYYYLANGTEHTGQFFDAGMFAADVFALTQDLPALQNIDALADSEVLLIPREALQAAYETDHAIERFGRRLIEQAMAGSQRRTASLLQMNAEQRYDRFVRMRPEVARRVPLYIIASYLGVTPEGLSRIRQRRAARTAGPGIS